MSFFGDPYFFSKKIFYNGQPKMDRGLTNCVLISLFTEKGYVGDYYETVENRKVGNRGRMLAAMKSEITVSALNDIRTSALADLSWMISKGLVSKIDINVTNPYGFIVQVDIKLSAPGGKESMIRLSNEQARWNAQQLDPVTLNTIETYIFPEASR